MNPPGFKWGQTSSSVSVTFSVPPAVTKTQVDVSITSSTLVAGIKSQTPVLSGTLFDHVITSRSAWKLKNSTVTISLQKLSKNNAWATLFLGASSDGSPTRPPAAPSSAPKKLMQCLHDYDATDPLELSFREGDVIVVIQENSTGWWKGELDGVVGLFPSNFTEEMPANQPVTAEYSEEVEELDEAQASVVSSATPKAQLTSKPAPLQIPTPTTGAPPSGAGTPPSMPVGTKPPPGAVAVMRPVMAGSGKPVALKTASAYEPRTVPVNGAASPLPVGKAPTPTPASITSVKAPSPAKPPASAKASAAAAAAVLPPPVPSAAGTADAGAHVRVIYNFVAQERGELSLRENDVVLLLKKDESGWWQGSVTYTGWFPASFVEEIVE